MDRLTKRGFDPELGFCAECDYHGEPNGCNRARGNCSAYAVFTDAYVRLAAYEDTGLTPDEVEILLIANGEKMQQIAALRAENEILKRTILHMQEQYENPPTRTCTTYRAALEGGQNEGV